MRETAGSASGQMQEFAAGKFHFKPPSRSTSLDHFVGAGEKRRRHVEAKCPGGLEIYEEVEFAWLHNR
jgi:hypothetical protein